LRSNTVVRFKDITGVPSIFEPVHQSVVASQNRLTELRQCVVVTLLQL
jgi:hypothetical protein